jgi:hypothetical protein
MLFDPKLFKGYRVIDAKRVSISFSSVIVHLRLLLRFLLHFLFFTKIDSFYKLFFLEQFENGEQPPVADELPSLLHQGVPRLR